MTATVIPFLIRREMERAAPASAGGNRLLKQLHEDAETLRQMLTTTKDGDELELILNCRAILRLRIEEWDFIVGKSPRTKKRESGGTPTANALTRNSGVWVSWS